MMIFQLSTHYLPKISLKIEFLCRGIEQSINETQTEIHHFALLHVIEMMKLIEKPELKSRFLKEFIKIEHLFNKSSVNISNAVLLKLHDQIQRLSHHTDKFGEILFQDIFLQSIRVYQGQYNSELEFDSPQLLFWLYQSAKKRQAQLMDWLDQLNHINQTVRFYLALLRDSAPFNAIEINHGFYQQAIPDKKTCDLVIVRLARHFNLIPKIQIGHHGINIRFCDALTMKELNNTYAQFELALCQLV